MSLLGVKLARCGVAGGMAFTTDNTDNTDNRLGLGFRRRAARYGADEMAR
jgi:hypothetical protein